MSRRSTRVRAKGVQEEAKPPSLASSSTTNPELVRKKQKVTASTEPTDAYAPTETTPAVPKAPAIWAKTRGRRGHLRMVAEMPFDILLEMFQYLAPLDLLNLSKANHAFRGLLLDRSTSLHLWKEVGALRISAFRFVSRPITDMHRRRSLGLILSPRPAQRTCLYRSMRTFYMDERVS
jgi:hypothetical protein